MADDEDSEPQKPTGLWGDLRAFFTRGFKSYEALFGGLFVSPFVGWLVEWFTQDKRMIAFSVVCTIIAFACFASFRKERRRAEKAEKKRAMADCKILRVLAFKDQYRPNDPDKSISVLIRIKYRNANHATMFGDWKLDVRQKYAPSCETKSYRTSGNLAIQDGQGIHFLTPSDFLYDSKLKGRPIAERVIDEGWIRFSFDGHGALARISDQTSEFVVTFTDVDGHQYELIGKLPESQGEVREVEASKPKIRTACNTSPDAPKDAQGSRGDNKEVDSLRVVLHCEGEAPITIKANLVEIKKGDRVCFDQNAAPLPIAPWEKDPMTATVYPDNPRFIDVIYVHKNGELKPGAFGWNFKDDFHTYFDEHGDYFFIVKIIGETIPTQTVRLRFTWTGDWKTSQLEKIETLAKPS